MGDTVGIVAALAVILAGVAFFVAVNARKNQAIARAGFAPTGAANDTLDRLAKALLDAAPSEIHYRHDAGGESWLAFVDAGGTDDPGCAMLVYPATGYEGISVALIRSGRRIPAFLRRLEGGLFDWMEPVEETATNGLNGTGWFAYKAPGQELPLRFEERASRAVRLPRAKGLLGFAVVDAHLAVWADTDRIKTLLQGAPEVRGTILPDSG